VAMTIMTEPSRSISTAGGSSTTAADSATRALKRANELNGDDNGQFSRGLGVVAAKVTKPEYVRPSESWTRPTGSTSAELQRRLAAPPPHGVCSSRFLGLLGMYRLLACHGQKRQGPHGQGDMPIPT